MRHDFGVVDRGDHCCPQAMAGSTAAAIEGALAHLEADLGDQRQQRSRNGAGEQQFAVVERQAGNDPLAEAARADERGNGRGADVDHRCGPDTGKDHRQRDRQLDRPQAWPPCRPSAVPASLTPAGTSSRPATGVAHDRKQRIERQRDQRRPGPDQPVREIRSASSASEGTVCSRPVARQHQPAQARPVCGEHAERDRQQRRRDDRDGHQHQVLEGDARQVVAEQLAGSRAARAVRRGRSGAALPRQEVARDRVEGAPSISASRVHRDHRRSSILPSSLPIAAQASGALRHIEPVKQHGVVLREVARSS